MKIAAALLTVTLLLGVVNTGVNEDVPDPDDAVYSDWLRPDDLLTDAPVSRGTQGKSTDLADFLDSVIVTGAEINEEGKYVILQGVPYTIQLNFSEKINSVQFEDDPTAGGLVYHFPEGFTPNPTSGTVEMTGDEGVARFNYVITGDTLTITFDETSPGYPSFITSERARFEIHTTGIISEEEIAFSSEVSGEFEIDNAREVSVRKTGSYDAGLNKVKYTVQAYSKGNNTNVHIGDIISGTALTYDPASLSVASNLQNPVPYNADTREGETFGLTIPTMSHGETVTIEYYADVNLDALTGTGSGHYGTISETANSVRIFSEEDPPGDDTTIDEGNFEHRITLSTNSKSVADQTVHDGKTYITWTVVLNEDANISIAGKTVTDTIDELSRAYMRYSGYGIQIARFEKDGTPAGTSEIRWGANGLSDGRGGSTWTYTIPEADADHAYRYVITYETEVDSDAFLKTTPVSNTVETEYDEDSGTAEVETTGEEAEAEKTAVQSVVDRANLTAETEWEITFTVPAAGLDSAVVIDSLPGIYDPATSRWFYDAYKAGSARVGDGDLLEGEGFTVDASQDHRVVITFTKNNGQSGLTGTGLTRTVHLFLTTTVGRDWLEFAESESRARTHVNYAVVRLNGQDLDVTGTVSYNTTDYEMEKVQVQDATFTTNTDPALPIYVYRIILTNVNDDVFDDDGFLTVSDTYDAGYLAFHPTYDNNDDYYVNTPNGHVYGNTQWNKYGMVSRGPYVVAEADPEGNLVFRLNKNDLPMNGSSYYPYYAIVYALQIKDAETLERIRHEALHAEGLKVELANIAGSEEFGTTTIVTEFTLNVLEKRLDGEEDNDGTGTHDLHFTIEVNEEGLKIGDEDTITVRDTLSSLSFDYTSITIEPQLEGDILNRSGYSVIFTLHNETHYTITYTARLIGIHNVHWNNRAELYGYIAGLNGTSSAESGGSGTYQTYSMNVLKYAEGNMSDGLAATFDLYEARVKDSYGNAIPSPVWEKVGEFTTDASTGIYQIRTVMREGASEAQSLRPYSFHDADGHEQFGSDGSESYGWRYRVAETAAPEGYRRIYELYEFGISDIPSYVAPYNYLNNDTVTIVNKPVPQETETEIVGKKILRGRDLKDREFAFTMTPEENVGAAWGEEYPGGFGESLTVRNDEAGYFRFPLSYTYDDYTKAVEKGFVDENRCACFYYVVRERVPEAAIDGFLNGVRYDASVYLVTVRLFIDGDRLRTEIGSGPYDPNRLTGDHFALLAPERRRNLPGL